MVDDINVQTGLFVFLPIGGSLQGELILRHDVQPLVGTGKYPVKEGDQHERLQIDPLLSAHLTDGSFIERLDALDTSDNRLMLLQCGVQLFRLPPVILHADMQTVKLLLFSLLLLHQVLLSGKQLFFVRRRNVFQ